MLDTVEGGVWDLLSTLVFGCMAMITLTSPAVDIYCEILKVCFSLFSQILEFHKD